ncbi:MAG: type I-E CRISPR-associated protein Cas6/Cse3/CasE [Nocardioidaceae bacterium]
MFLTQMHLNPARRGTRHLLSSPQRVHAAVMLAFPPGTDADLTNGRILWRVETNRNTCTLYVSSPSEPDLTHVIEQAGWPAASTSGWRTVSTDGFLARLAYGQEWVFRLTANPVHSRRNPDGGRGKRYGHVTVAQQEEWLRHRSADWGFNVLSGSVTSRRMLSFSRCSGGDSRPVTLSVATFDGLLRVLDSDQFRSSLNAGVGKAKGYGCGLITLAPSR